MLYSKRVGEEIKNLRNKKHLTQENLAERAHLNPAHLGHVEQGRREAKLKTLVKIADALGVRVKDLIPF